MRVGFDLFLAGSLLIMTLYHLALYIYRRRDFAILLFGLFCILFTVRVMLSGEIALTAFLPGFPWGAMIRIEYADLYLSGMIAAMFYQSLYPSEFNLKVLRVVQGLSALFLASLVFLPPRIFLNTLFPNFLLIMAILCYCLYVIVLAGRRHKRDAYLFLTGFVFIFLAVLNDMLLAMEMINSIQMINFSFVFFIISQAIALSRRFSHALNTVERQSVELVRANAANLAEIRKRARAEAELTRYRDYLEDLVKERTAKLRAANASLRREMEERRRAEDELLKARKIESLGLFAGGIAHDFNNLLAAIMGNISIVRTMLGGSAREEELLAEAEKACFRARDLTGQLLTFSKGGLPIKRLTRLRTLLRETMEFVLRGSPVQGSFDIHGDLWDVEADRGQISQVVHNLVINAVQAFQGSGAIRLAAANVLPGDALPAGLAPGRYVRIAVSDNGPGIPAQNLDRVFDPYFTTKSTGSGLGLSVCYSIIMKHGGRIHADSSPGEGTVFTIHLPASLEREEEALMTERGEARFSGRVLVMDDEAAVAKVLARMLEKLGLEAVTVGDGEMALAAYRDAQSKGKQFDAVVTDLTIPGGMGGRDAISLLLAEHPGARAVASSGYSNDPVMANFTEYGFMDVLPKPFALDDVVRVMGRVLGQG